MKVGSYVLLSMLLFTPLSSLAAPVAEVEERAIINAVLTHLFSYQFGGVEAVVAPETEPLPLLQADRNPESLVSNYDERNRRVLLLTEVPLPDTLSLGEPGSFGEQFSWDAHRASFGDAWLVRVSRPGIDEQGMALVRVDVARSDAIDSSGVRVPSGTEYVVRRSGNDWTIVSAKSRPYRNPPTRVSDGDAE